MRAHIRAVSYYLPEQKLTNDELSKTFPDLTDQYIYERTGVRNRHISAPQEIGSDVAYAAANQFFKEHAIAPEEVDFLLFCTEGLDHKAPTSACILQDRLGLPKHAGAMDIPMGCTGFVYGLSLAKAIVESHGLRNVLLLTSDVPSKVIHPEDFELRMIFGDAGAATLIGSEEEQKGWDIGKFVFGTDGSGAKNLHVEYSGAREPMTKAWLEEYKDADGMKWGKMHMNGVEIFIFSIRIVPPMIEELLKKNECTMDDIDLFVFHQANGYLLEILRKKLKIPKEKFFVYMENIGNTVSATIPIALKEAEKQKKIENGKKVMIVSFGIGYSWAGTILTV